MYIASIRDQHIYIDSTVIIIIYLQFYTLYYYWCCW